MLEKSVIQHVGTQLAHVDQLGPMLASCLLKSTEGPKDVFTVKQVAELLDHSRYGFRYQLACDGNA